MAGQKGDFRYRLGIDVGVASLGIAILEMQDGINAETGEPNYRIHSGSVRTYPIPGGAVDRRLSRGMRRNTKRRKTRLERLSSLLAGHGVGFKRGDEPKDLLDLSPIKMRAKASREKVDLAHLSRAILHMARHRGSSAFRESAIKDDKEARQTAEGMKNLREEMKAKNFATYGQYLRWHEKNDRPTRINSSTMTSSKVGYSFYPSREILREEFNIIWDKQSKFYPDILTDTLKDKVEDELFFQRAITTPPPGKCPYFPHEDRLPKLSRLFQIRRIYEESNHLRFSSKVGATIAYDLAQRDKIVDRLMAGEDLTFAEIKKTIGLGRADKVSLEDTKSRKGIVGYPFDRELGASQALGDQWSRAGCSTQDRILNVLARVHDDAKALEGLAAILGGDRETAKRALEISLPSGWGHMGQTATEKILEKLKADVVPARIAEDRAGLYHVMTPDGVIHERLPYYGEILVGHTSPPVWVSDYRRDTDRPPNTNPEEQQFGRIPNPVVHLALRQIRRVVNATIDKFGIPEAIHIELARELNKSAEAREEIAISQARYQKESDAAAIELAANGIKINRLNIQKYKLWKEQGGVCIYTGEALSFDRLYHGDVDLDHILPRSITYLDSMANKLVCLRTANADKANRAPYEAFANNAKYDWAAIVRRVNKLQDNKKWRFEADAMKLFEEDKEGFRARYGVDNSYIARVAGQYLACLYGEPQNIVAISSHIVSKLRGKWGLLNILGSKGSGKKSRDDHRHHFIDALVTACATRGMVQRIQTEAARCEAKQLDEFIEKIKPPFGDTKEFFNAAREATFERVTLTRKSDHSSAGQLHEDSFLGVVHGPDDDGKFVCRKRKKLTDYNTLEKLDKPKIEDTLPDNPEINGAREALAAIKASVRGYVAEAIQELEVERKADIASGKKGKKISDMAIYSRAVEKHKNAGGKIAFVLYEKNKLVNLRRAGSANRPYGGYVSGRNHRKDIYLDNNGQLRWQLVSMMQANDKAFTPQAKLPGNRLLWSAHKEDVVVLDDPDNPDRRIRVVIAKLSESKLGVIPETDARDSKERVMWEKGMSFFYKLGAQRIVTDALGTITWRFPALPRSGKMTSPP